MFATALVTLAQDDGRYRPTEAPTSSPSTPTNPFRTFQTTTRVPVYKYNDPRYGWNSGRVWPNERYDPRYDTAPRFDSRFNTPGEQYFMYKIIKILLSI